LENLCGLGGTKNPKYFSKYFYSKLKYPEFPRRNTFTDNLILILSTKQVTLVDNNNNLNVEYIVVKKKEKTNLSKNLSLKDSTRRKPLLKESLIYGARRSTNI
jgi:hypothetical protein